MNVPVFLSDSTQFQTILVCQRAVRFLLTERFFRFRQGQFSP